MKRSLLIVVGFLVACSSAYPLEFDTEGGIHIDDLQGSWSFLQEGNLEGESIWTTDEDLPPSRFRQQMFFHADGTVDVLVAHPADGHFFVVGQYSLEGNVLEIEYTIPELGPSFPEYTVTVCYEILDIFDDELHMIELSE